MVILITGGAGFVGSNLAVFLKGKQKEIKIIALDNLKRRGSEVNLNRLRDHGIKFIHGDIRNQEDLNLKSLNLTHIIECSAEPSVVAGLDNPDYMVKTNLVGLANCLELARICKAKMIFLSSSRIYPIEGLNRLKYSETATRYVLTKNQPLAGASFRGVSEEFPLKGWRSLYGATKLASELLIEEYIHAYNLKAVINRCGVIAGAGQMGKVDQGVFMYFLLNHYFKKPLKYIGYGGSGKQVRDILHIDDLAELIYFQIKNLDKLNDEIFNVGGGNFSSLSLLETTKICRELTGHTVTIQKVKSKRHADIPIYISDCSRVTKMTGWTPKRHAQTILSDIYRWVKSNDKTLAQALF